MIYTKGVTVEQVGPTMELFRIANVVDDNLGPRSTIFVSKRVEGNDFWVLCAQYDNPHPSLDVAGITVAWSPEIREALLQSEFERLINLKLGYLDIDPFSAETGINMLIPVEPRNGIYVPMLIRYIEYNGKTYIEFAMVYEVVANMSRDNQENCITGRCTIDLYNSNSVGIHNSFQLDPDNWNMKTVIQSIRERIGSQGILPGVDDGSLISKWIPDTYSLNNMNMDMDIDMLIYHRETFGMDAQLVNMGGVD